MSFKHKLYKLFKHFYKVQTFNSIYYLYYTISLFSQIVLINNLTNIKSSNKKSVLAFNVLNNNFNLVRLEPTYVRVCNFKRVLTKSKDNFLTCLF